MWLVAILGVAARYLTKYVVTKGMLVLGLGFVTYTGVQTFVDNLETELMAQFNGLPADAFNLAAMCGIDVAITIIISALVMSITIRGISTGARMLTSIGR